MIRIVWGEYDIIHGFQIREAWEQPLLTAPWEWLQYRYVLLLICKLRDKRLRRSRQERILEYGNRSWKK